MERLLPVATKTIHPPEGEGVGGGNGRNDFSIHLLAFAGGMAGSRTPRGTQRPTRGALLMKTASSVVVYTPHSGHLLTAKEKKRREERRGCHFDSSEGVREKQ